MNNIKMTAIIEKGDDGYFTAKVPELKSCYTQAKTIEALYPRLREVIGLCIEEEGIPEPRLKA